MTGCWGNKKKGEALMRMVEGRGGTFVSSSPVVGQVLGMSLRAVLRSACV